MNIDEISTLVAIAELGSFTRAAQRLHRTQPAISRRLDVPAMRTAIPIIAVHRRNGYLSPAARALLELLRAEARRPVARRQRNEPPRRSLPAR